VHELDPLGQLFVIATGNGEARELLDLRLTISG
jgi:hypothetical protein